MKTPIKNIKYVLIVTILLVLTSCASFDMAQNNEYLGSAYYEGKDGFKQDYAEALRYFKLAAAKNSLLAQYNLGTMYLYGIGVKQDYTEALLYFKLAAAQNNSSAQTNLGYMYENGYGVTQNYTEASKWYKLAAAQNNFSAQANLGYLYYKGVGVSQNYAEALRYLKLSASQNYSDAQNFLGYMYENSIGGYSSQDNILAFVWTKLAAAQGNKSAITRSEIVNKKLTFIELSIAMKVSKECSSIKLKIVDCIDLAMLNNLTKNNDTKNINTDNEENTKTKNYNYSIIKPRDLDISNGRKINNNASSVKNNNEKNTKIETNDFNFAEAEKKCTELGFKAKSEKFADCVIKLSR